MSDKEKIEEHIEKPKEPEEKLLRMLFIQNLDQVKHLRSMIMWFTDLYIGVIIGAVALLGSKDFKDQSFLLTFFVIVAVLGLLITLRMDSRIKGRVSIGKKIMRKLDLSEYMMDSTGTFTWRQLLIIFYFIMGVYWMYLLID
jgi:hypothetical protein